ncbi:reverse transcriptase domain-containing protein [Tanacetum coccineum]
MNKPPSSVPLPSNTVAIPKGDLKAITTQSGVYYDGPPIPPPFSSSIKVVEREPKVTKDLVQPSTKKVQPLEIVECLALVDLGASINLMSLSIWRKISLPELTPTQMILELADRSTTRPTGIAEDIFMRVGKYAYNDAESINRIAVIEIDCEEYSQEVLGFFDNSESGNPTPISEPIIAKSSPSLTLFERGDFILEEIETYLASDSVPPGIDDIEFNPKGDIRLIEEILNKDSYSPLPLKDLMCEELKSVKSIIDEPLELELKDLPSHLEYVFLEGTNKLPVIIAKNLKDEEKERLIKKCHFMVKEGIVIGHKISKSAIEVDRAKVDVIAKLPPPIRSRPSVYRPLGLLRSAAIEKKAKPRYASVYRWILILQELECPFPSSQGKKYILVAVDYLSKWVDVKALPNNDARVVCRTVGENRASCSDKLEDALWSFCTAFKTPIGCTPYKLVYGKACHLPIELEHKAYWALKH